MKAEKLAELKAYKPKPTDLVDWAKVQTVILEDYPELIAEVEHLQKALKKSTPALHEFWVAEKQKNVELRAEIARLRKALEFYADEEDYDDTITTTYGYTCAIAFDEGKTAREALQNGD